MCRSPHAPGSRSSRSAPIAVSARQYQSLLRDLRKCGIRISRSSSQSNCAARSRGRRGAGSEVTRDKWYSVERARRCKQSARSRAVHRLVIPVCLTPLLQVWQSAAANSQVRRSAVLQSVLPVPVSWLLSQWRAGYLSQVQVALYPDPHAAPFAPTSATSSSVAQRVVERRYLRPPVPTLPAAFKLLVCVLLPLRTVVRRWQQRRPRHTNSTGALKLLQCTFTPLRAVLRRWWSRDLFESHHVKHIDEVHFLDFRNQQACRDKYLRLYVPALCKFRYLRVHRTVVLKCTLVPMLSFIHRWWDLHLLPHPADRPHLYAGKYTKKYLLSVRQDFNVNPISSVAARLQELRAKGWFYCEWCKHKYKLKFMGERCSFCVMCEFDFDY
jgi:hypothetical protein